jgi:hypothetical protein
MCVSVSTAIGSYACLRYILKRMWRLGTTILGILLLAGCATSRTAAARVGFPNATPNAPRQVPATIYRPSGDGPFPAMALFHGCHGVS